MPVSNGSRFFYAVIRYPNHTPARQTITDTTIFKASNKKLPVSSRLKFSKEKVEKVEKPPQKPVIKNIFWRSDNKPALLMPKSSPNRKLARKLAISVANGKLDSELTNRFIAYLHMLPKPPPKKAHSIFIGVIFRWSQPPQAFHFPLFFHYQS